MRPLPPALAARLARETATLCRCWTLRRRDGRVLGFTDHDRDLVLDGVTHAARAGLEASEATAELGFAVGGGEVAGALTAAGLTEAEVAEGLYDGAGLETWLVDWSDPSVRLLLDAGSLGEIRRADAAFVAEVRSLMHALDAVQGRTYAAACDARLGDARCRVVLDDPRLTAEGTLAQAPGDPPTRLVVALPARSDPAFFAGGRLTWTGGANAGRAEGVRAQAGAVLDLWRAPARTPAAGDPFVLTAGCDRRFETCAAKFSNTANFQGFPHLPGNDFVARQVPGSGPGLDGGSLFR